MSISLELKKERYEVETEWKSIMYVTQYSNEGYTVFVIEDRDDYYANVVRNDNKYPEIYSNGINVAATGILNRNELYDHIERLIIAKGTYELIFKMFKGIKIK